MDEIEILKAKNVHLQARIEKMERTYNLKRCWLCGTEKNLTQHHLQMKGKRVDNLGTIPLCRECHNKVEDARNGMKSLFKNFYREEFEKQMKAFKRKSDYWKNKYQEIIKHTSYY